MEESKNFYNNIIEKRRIAEKKFDLYKEKRRIFAVIGAVFFLLLIFIFRDTLRDIIPKILSEDRMSLFVNKNTPTPTPFPFRELTISYLREREYKSEMGGGLEKIYDGQNYSAYVTSYLSDGFKINGLITIPRNDGESRRYPAIVFIHGYIPPAQYQTEGSAYSSYVDYLANSGFVVFKIDLRGHGESEGSPSGAYFSSDYVIDTLNAYSALVSEDFVDPEKIGLWGHSMAGNIVMRAFAARPDIPAVVIWAGAVYTYEDMQKYRIRDLSYSPPTNVTQRRQRRGELFEKYGSPSGEIKFWREVAPVYYLKDLRGAIQIHHAVDDEVVDIGYSRDLNEFLKKTSAPHEFYEYSEGGHNISGASFNSAMQRTVEFFKKYLSR